MTTSRRIIPVRPLIKTSGVRASSSDGPIKRTTNLPGSQSCTMCGWFRLVTDRSVSQDYVGLMELGMVASTQQLLAFEIATTAMEVYNGGNAFFATRPKVGVWFFAALTMDENIRGFWAYPGSAFVKTSGLATGSFTPDVMVFAGDSRIGEWLDGESAHMRVWKRALTEAELYAEMNSPFAVSRKALDTDILGWNDRRNRGPGGEWTYTAVSGGTQELSLDRPVFMPLRKPETRPARIVSTKKARVFQDSFDVADQPLQQAGSWIRATGHTPGPGSGVNVVSGKLRPASSGDNVYFFNKRLGEDHWVEMQVNTAGTDWALIVASPYPDLTPGSGLLMCYTWHMSAGLANNLNGWGSRAQFGSVPTGQTAGDTFRFEIKKGRLYLYRNNALIYTINDTQATYPHRKGGYVGFFAYNTGGFDLDNFRCGDEVNEFFPTRTPSGVNWTKHRG